MSNYTIEDYKKAIKDKYEKETDGEYSNNLSSPTSANLRNLCVKRFESNNSRDDLIAFESFFEFPFDKEKKNLFGEDELNKLEAVKRFLLGKTEKPAEDTIQLAAILVDLQPRPFREYKRKFEEDEEKLMEELKRPNFSNQVIATDNLKDEVKTEEFKDSETTTEIEEPEQIEIEEPDPTPTDEQKNTLIGIMNIPSTGTKPPFNIVRFFAIGVVLIGLGFIIYLALPDTECMQWSNDHYEIVDCSQETQGFVKINQVELLDKSLINLKKVNVCDTTPCFDKNGAAIIWYAKTANGIDFFNGHGRHPENNKALRPITPYIFNKYVKK